MFIKLVPLLGVLLYTLVNRAWRLSCCRALVFIPKLSCYKEDLVKDYRNDWINRDEFINYPVGVMRRHFFLGLGVRIFMKIMDLC